MRIPIVVLGLSLALAADAAPQEADPYTFLLIVGGDTVASDIVQRTPDGLHVDLISVATGIRSDMTMTLAPDESVLTVTVKNYRLEPTDTAPFQTLVSRFVGDTVRVELTMAGRGTRTASIPTTAGAVPYLQTSSVAIEQVLRRARVTGGETATVPVFDLGSARTNPAVVRWLAADSAVVQYEELELHATVDHDGSLLSCTIPDLDWTIVRLEGAHPLVPDETDR